MRLFGLWWDEPLVWLALLIVPVLLWTMFRKRAPGRVLMPTSGDLAAIHRGTLADLWWLPDVLRIFAVIVAILAVSRPQKEDRRVVTGQGVDIMVALDMSSSMNAVDMPEPDLVKMIDSGVVPKSRFDAAVDILKGFVESRGADQQDRIGLVVFGKEAWLKYPLTLDYSRLIRTLGELVLDNGQKDMRTERCTNGCTVDGAGTAIGDALGRAYNRLRRSKSNSRIIMLVTDGKQEGGTLDSRAIARHISDLPDGEKVKVFTFLVGNNDQTWFPRYDMRGRRLKHRNGTLAFAQLDRPMPVDPQLLRDIAGLTEGGFYESENEQAFRADVKDLERTVFKQKLRVSREDVFWPWLLAALLLLAFEHLLRFTRFRSVA